MKEKTYNELSQALRALAETDAAQEAAPKVEAALLQAMRQTSQQAAPTRVLHFPARRQPFAWRWALAAAAALLLLSFGWLVWRQPPAPQSFVTKTAELPPAPEPKHERGVGQVTNLPYTTRVNQKRKRQDKNHALKILPVEEEIATEFFPLVSQDVLPARGQLQRVQLPRSTLINFGLPVNAERIAIPINADLLVGEDGAARAIRFVQERFPDEAVINVYGNTGRKTIPTSFRNPR